jgi:histidinol-phosphate aminotransferase
MIMVVIKRRPFKVPVPQDAKDEALTQTPRALASEGGSLVIDHNWPILPPFEPSEQMRDPSRGIRLGLSESSAGYCQEAVEALRAEVLLAERYPDASASSLTRALARHTGLPENAIVIGNGIDELLLFSALAFLSGGGSGAVCESTYPGHLAAVAAVHAHCVTVPLTDDLTVDIEAIARSLQTPRTVAIVCNPHNPTGSAVPAEQIRSLAHVARANDSLLIVDEAYMEYAEPDHATSAIPYVSDGYPVVVLRTFSKIYGLAGLRCGYALAPAVLADRLRRIKNVTPYSVNRFALAAAEAALGNQDFVASVRLATRSIMREFRVAMDGVPWFTACPSVTNFLLCTFPWEASRTATELSKRGVMVRPCADLGLPRELRISMGTRQQMTAVTKVLTEIAQRFLPEDPP